MSDLYRGLIKRNLRKGQNGEEFWGKYNSLDSVPIPNPDIFLRLQVEGLKQLEASEDYSAVNTFLAEAQQNLAIENSQMQGLIENEAYARIVELLNSGLTRSTNNPYQIVKAQGGYAKRGNEAVNTEINKIIIELTQLLQQINASEGISKDIINAVKSRLESFEWGPTPQSYIMEKANLVEALMAERLNQNEGFRSIVTGAWTNQGMQLIEDMFAFAKDKEYDLFTGDLAKMKFSVKLDNGSVHTGTAKSAGNLLDQLEKIKGNYSVSLSDELYSALQQAAIISGQAKSGMSDQAILNKNKRNAITLEDINFDPKLLWELYQADLQEPTQYFKEYGKQNSEDLAALANYALSRNITQTAINRNKLYLTSDGFVTASQWMELHGRYLMFVPAIKKVDGSFMSAKRPYFFSI